MSTIDSDIVAAVKELRGHVSAQRYAEAIETLKEDGGEIGAFAGMYAALVTAFLGGLVGTGALMATLSNPIAIGVVWVTGSAASILGVALGAEKINSMYESMDSTQRQAPTEALAFGIEQIWALGKFWKLIS